MKQILKLIPVMLMITAIAVAGCGDKKEKKGDDKKGADTEKKEDSAANTPAADGIVATKVSLPGMDTHWS